MKSEFNETIRETKGHVLTIEDGILYVYVKPHEHTIELMKDFVDAMKSISQDKKQLVVIDPTASPILNMKQRNFVMSAFDDSVKAMAVINQNIAVYLMHSLMVKINKPKYQMKLFKHKEDAIAWLNSKKRD